MGIAFMIVGSFALMITAGVVRYWWVIGNSEDDETTNALGRRIVVNTGGRVEEGIWRMCRTTLLFNNVAIKTDAELEEINKNLKKNRNYYNRNYKNKNGYYNNYNAHNIDNGYNNYNGYETYNSDRNRNNR